MDDVNIGIFHLVDPPEGQDEVVADAVAHVDYPWQRIIPAIREDPDQAVIVRWPEKMQQGTTGLFYGHTYEIHLSPYERHYESAGFVFAHEVGHLVDRATFDGTTRQKILDKYHTDLDGRWDGQVDPNDRSDDPAPFAWSHENEHPEKWVNNHKEYKLRPNEAYADSFVAAFAPTIWEGRYSRFAHWTEDFEAIRRMTLEREIQVFEDVGEDHPHREGIEWAAGQGLVKGYDDGTFRPSEPVTRAQLSTILYRQAE